MQCPSPSIIDWISCFFTICSALCGGTHLLCSSLSVSINPICWLRGWVGCPCICTFTAFYDGLHVKLHFEACVHLQPFAYIRVSCYAFCVLVSICGCSYICWHSVFALQSTPQRVCAFVLQANACVTVHKSSCSRACTLQHEQTCVYVPFVSDSSGTLSILIRPAVGRR